MKSYVWVPLVAIVAAPAYAQQADNRSPDAVVKGTIESVMASIKADPAAQAGDLDKIAALVEQKFVPSTDFLLTTQYAVGKPWAGATPAQQKALFEQFQTLLVHTYAAELNQIRDQGVQFKFAGPQALPSTATDAVVKTVVINNGDTMNIDYRVTKTAEGWKIYDINMMGAWLIGVYRQQFAEQIAKGGIDGLVKFIAAHNAVD